MGMMKEFKEFAMKGNLVDMAVAFVMGAAFGKVTSAFIDGMVMPLVGQLTGGEWIRIAHDRCCSCNNGMTGHVHPPEVPRWRRGLNGAALASCSYA